MGVPRGVVALAIFPQRVVSIIIINKNRSVLFCFVVVAFFLHAAEPQSNVTKKAK